jgi:hypothetical protein
MVISRAQKQCWYIYTYTHTGMVINSADFLQCVSYSLIILRSDHDESVNGPVCHASEKFFYYP